MQTIGELFDCFDTYVQERFDRIIFWLYGLGFRRSTLRYIAWTAIIIAQFLQFTFAYLENGRRISVTAVMYVLFIIPLAWIQNLYARIDRSSEDRGLLAPFPETSVMFLKGITWIELLGAIPRVLAYMMNSGSLSDPFSARLGGDLSNIASNLAWLAVIYLFRTPPSPPFEKKRILVPATSASGA